MADTSRLVQPVAQTYITNSRQVDWLGGWIGGYMLCGWCSLSTSCMHGGILVRPFFCTLSRFNNAMRSLSLQEHIRY